MEINEVIEQGIKKLAELNLDGQSSLRYRLDDIYHKPASHRQVCFVCYGVLQKGDLVRREQSGATHSGFPTYAYAHLDCFLALLFHTITKVDGDK